MCVTHIHTHTCTHTHSHTHTHTHTPKGAPPASYQHHPCCTRQTQHWVSISVNRDLTSVKRDLITVKRDRIRVKRDLTSVKRDLTSVKRDQPPASWVSISVKRDLTRVKRDLTSVKGDQPPASCQYHPCCTRRTQHWASTRPRLRPPLPPQNHPRLRPWPLSPPIVGKYC